MDPAPRPISHVAAPAPGLPIDPFDLFVHDADHSYAAQLEELRTIWPHLRYPGGVILMDDVGNPAALEFAAKVATDLWLVGY